tara:strand:- start:2128 stop:2880 length:753 start_codon:yes stop_codon:yes gene_type:complete
MFYIIRILLGIALGLFIHQEVHSASYTDISAKSWAVANPAGEVLIGINLYEIRPIASITKLMTVLVVLDAAQPLNEVLTKTLFQLSLTRLELIELALIKSNNEAAKILCDNYPGGFRACVQAMNDKAIALNMKNTTFTDPTGLYQTNTSTAIDLIKLVLAASTYPIIVSNSNRNSMSIVNGKKTTTFYNTNPKTGALPFLVSKTGYISKSGGCIAVMQETPHGVRIAIVLGSKDTKTRILEFQSLTTNGE